MEPRIRFMRTHPQRAREADTHPGDVVQTSPPAAWNWGIAALGVVVVVSGVVTGVFSGDPQVWGSFVLIGTIAQGIAAVMELRSGFSLGRMVAVLGWILISGSLAASVVVLFA